MLSDQRVVDVTELATLGEQFPLRLMQLGFRLMQAMDAAGHDVYQYVLPPVCEVPAGPFLMGSSERRDPGTEDDEVPQHEIILATFQIGAYPVTVAEYACAVQARAIQEPATERVNWRQQLTCPDHPVVNITWFQAAAYAAWLARITGNPYRLPKEAEWEKAARGTDGRRYPWGDKRVIPNANAINGGQGAITPVGAYMDKEWASPYGVYEMTGNVDEWCNSLYRPYPYRADDGREDNQDSTNKRVLRGGVWRGSPVYTRAASRNTGNPASFNYDIGMRLVVNADE